MFITFVILAIVLVYQRCLVWIQEMNIFILIILIFRERIYTFQFCDCLLVFITNSLKTCIFWPCHGQIKSLSLFIFHQLQKYCLAYCESSNIISGSVHTTYFDSRYYLHSIFHQHHKLSQSFLRKVFLRLS